MKKILITIVCLMALVPALAQERMLYQLEQLREKYPQSILSVGYSCYKSAEDIYSYSSKNIKFRRAVKDLSAEELEQLLNILHEELQNVKLGRDRAAGTLNADSVSVTIIHNPNIQQVLNRHSFMFKLEDSGFLAYDQKDTVEVASSFRKKIEGGVHPVSFSHLDSLLHSLALRPNVDQQKVKFTGNKGLFDYLYGQGKGWTKGTRFTVPNTSVADYYMLASAVYKTCGGNTDVWMSIGSHNILIFDCTLHQGAVIIHRLDNGTLYFLHAQVEEELCIPNNWHKITEYNNKVIQ